jgi:plasmid stability protein
MTDILVRGVPDDVVEALDARAAALGISRTELVRRRLAQESELVVVEVTVDDFHHLSEALPDLGDPEVMRDAWR